ncbi:hypothetical protein GGR56DRAFT_508490 [Xylariaceae sp. FL0804]|nr:hypothetical protein GGR56DRAFT_508490 [Xylariaceae sp. FL0804]
MERMNQIHSTGITELVVPPSPLIDICFVHGFTGHPERTWRSKKRTNRVEPGSGSGSEGPSKRPRISSYLRNPNRVKDDAGDVPETLDHVYWPKDLVPDIIPQARVLTFGYDTNIRHTLINPPSANRLIEHAQDFLSALEACRIQEPRRPLVFIAHSLGGILVKDLLRESKSYIVIQPDRSLIYQSTTHLLFFGTPHAGADPRNGFHRALTSIVEAAGFRANRDIMQTLMPGAERLVLLKHDFQAMIDERDWGIYTFQEDLAHPALGRKIVEDSSSSIDDRRHERKAHIRADHVDMCRFNGQDDPEFRKVAAVLSRILPKASTISKATHLDEISESQAPPEVPRITPEMRQQFLKKLRFDGIDARYGTLKTAQGKTCQWLLNHRMYEAWQDPAKLQEHNGFLWIKGKPGTGKSIMMKYLLQKARAAPRKFPVISFFFNARGAVLERSTEGLYRSLLYQLVESIPDLRDEAQHIGLLLRWGADRSWPIETLKQAFETVVEQIGARELLCFIDALDECPERDVRDMIHFFEDIGEKAAQSGYRIRVCLSSRHYPYITVRTNLQLTLEKELDHSDDIRHFIQARLRMDNPKKRQEVGNEILERSSHVFLWVTLVVDILNKAHDEGGDLDVGRRLKQIPTGLHDLFHDILTRDNKNLPGLIMCLQWILYAKRPLKPEELYFALQLGFHPESSARWNQDSVPLESINRYNLDISKGLVEITRKKVTVQFIHESVRDYLLQEGGLHTLMKYHDAEGDFSEGVSHDVLKRICLKQVLKLADGDADNGSVDLEERVKAFPLMEYAVCFVLSHSDSAQALTVDQTTFLTTFPKEVWVSLHNSLKKFESLRHRSAVDLLYLLAEQGLASLIEIHPNRSKGMFLHNPNERYGNPMRAAMALGHHTAVRSLAYESAKAVSLGAADPRLAIIIDELLDLSHIQPDRRRPKWKRDDRLTTACRLGSPTFVEMMWDHLCPDPPPDCLATTLKHLPDYKRIPMANLLLQKGAAIDGRDGTWPVGHTALAHAVEDNDIITAEYLVSRGASIASEELTQLLALSQTTSMARLVLQVGADLLDPNCLATTLKYLPDCIRIPMANFLLQKGAAINGRDRMGYTALAHAVEDNDIITAEYLVSRGASIDSEECSQLLARSQTISMARLVASSGRRPPRPNVRYQIAPTFGVEVEGA